MAETADTTSAESSATSKTRGSRATESSASNSNVTGSSAGGEFTCPECGRGFGRAAALGAHRRSHGVAGRSASAAKSRSARGGSRAGGRGRRLRGGGSTATSSGGRGGGRRSGSIDRDALLRALFPNGVPAREQTLSAVGAWLDEAERLARLR